GGAAALTFGRTDVLPFATFLLLVGFVNWNVKGYVGRVFVTLGDASYSIYLLHPLVFVYVYIHLQPPLPPLWIQEPLRYGSFVLICLLSIASWRFFERPINQLGKQMSVRSSMAAAE